jgi:sugar phosphate permease
LVLAAIGGVVFSAAQNFPMLIVGRILLALAVSGFLIGGAKIISAWFTSTAYPLLWGLFMGIGALGSVVGTKPLQMAMSTYGWRSSMLGVAIFSLVLAVFAYMILRDRPAEKGIMTPDELAGIVPETKAEDAPVEKESIGTVLKMPILWLIGLISFGGNSAAQTFGGLWEGVYLANVFHFDKPMIGSIMSWYAWGIVAGCFLSGPIVKALGSKKTMLIGVVIVAINWIWLMTQPGTISVAELRIFNFLLGGLQMVVISTTFIFCREVFPISRLGTAMGFLNCFVWIIAAGAMQQIWGVVIDAVSKGVQPYPINAFVDCMWIQMIMSVIGVLSAIYVWKSPKYRLGS